MRIENARKISGIQTLYALGMSRIADCDIGVTRPFTSKLATGTSFSGPITHLDQEQRTGLCIQWMIEDETGVQEGVHQA